MAKDFKANQVRTSKIIISGSETGKPALLVYSASDATNFAGGYQTDMLTNVGSDVFLFVSGNNNSVISNNRSKVTLFGGDVVVSGTFYAEKLVAEVNTTVNSDHHISGGIYLTEKGSDPEALTDQVALYSKDVGGSSKLFYRSTDKIVELGAQATGTFHVPQPSEFVTTASVSIAGSSQGFSYTADSVGSDVRFHVSGTSAFVGPVKISGSLNQALNGVASEYGTVTGKQTLASGDFSHAQGFLTTGSGVYSHAEGGRTIASGIYTHAEGFMTTASADYSHSEGAYTTASNIGAHSEGFRTDASGEYSHAEGGLTFASGDKSHAEGHGTHASGDYAHAAGLFTTASGEGARSAGQLSVAVGKGSHAEGYASNVVSAWAHAEGFYTRAAQTYSHAEGYFATASGIGSHAEGQYTTAQGHYSHAEGTLTKTTAAAHAEGYGTLASNAYAHAEGYYATASGQYSHAEGKSTIANGAGSHAEGGETNASGIQAHSEGYFTKAQGHRSHAEGLRTTSSGQYSHAEGNNTLASGESSHTQGYFTTASGDYSFASGLATIADQSYQNTFGKFNKTSQDNSLFAVGVGGSSNDRYDALSVYSGSSGWAVTVGTGTLGTDVLFHVTGTVASRDSATKGTALFSGDMVVSGGLTVMNNDNLSVTGGTISGSIHHTHGGKSYLAAGTNVTITSASDGQVTISSFGGVDISSGGAANRISFFTDGDSIAGDNNFQFDSTGDVLHLTGASSQGLMTVAQGAGSHAEGRLTHAGANYSHAEGYFATASEAYAHAEGYHTLASGESSHAEGQFTTASSFYAHAEGDSTQADGSAAHAEGYGTFAQGNASHTEGFRSKASGNYSHAEGYFATSSAQYAHAEGAYTIASGQGAHAEGNKTLASGIGSHTEGLLTTASNVAASARGLSTDAVGAYSHAGGMYTIASGSGQTIVGQYNKQGNTTSLFGVGVGMPGDRTDGFLVNTSSIGYSVHVGTGSNTKLIVDEAGSVGVGVENPLGKMHIKSGDSGQPAPSGFADDLIIEGSESTGISILTPNNQVGRIYFGDNDNEQRGYVLYDHNLDVMKFSVANGNRMIIDQGGLSGSLTNLVDGTSYIKAGSNITVASESNGSLTISAAAGGTIGAAEDGSYADGLFTSFTSATTIGTAIDRINEVLKYLAPSPARNVNDINADQTGTDARLSFGDLSSNNPSGYATGSAHTGSNTLAEININSEFNVATGSGGDLRLAVFNSPTTISGFINSKELQSDYNGGSVVNHVEDAFGDAERGTLSLEINGSTVVSIELTGSAVGNGVPGSGTATHLGTGDHSSTGFIQLSQTGSAKTQSDVDFPVFQHRTGKYTIAAGSQRKGYNYAKVKHVVGSTTHTTNFVEWVYDQDGTNASTPISANDAGFVIDPLAGGTNRFDMSGVRYSVTGSGEYRVRVENFYKHVYATNAISNSITNSSIASTTPSTVPTIGVGEDHTKVLNVTSSFNTTTSTMLGTTVAGDISVAHPTKTGLSFGGSVTSGRFLMYSGSVTSTDTSETFDHEAYRLQSGSFDAQTDVTGGSYDWNSTVHMTASNGGHSDGMQFYNGVLKSPTQTLNNGDFRSVSDGGSYFGNGYIYDEQPNYASESGLRTFYRKIKNTTGSPIRDFKIQFNAGNTTIPTIVSQGTSLDTQKMKVFARLPGEAGSEWLDLGTEFRYHTSSNRSGGRANTTLNTGGSPINYFTFGTGSVANDDFFVIKIEADASLTRDIGGITFTLPGIGGTTSHAPNASTLNSTNGTGADGKLSFGSSKPISSYNNVTGTSPSFEGAVDINEAFNVAGNRYGIFNSTTDLVGVINHDVNSAGNSYPNDAFGGGNAHLGSLKLEINGSIVHTVDLTNLNLEGTTNGSNSGFTNLSIATNATGSNGIVADYTKFWRTGNYIIKGSDFVNGRNFARVIHSVTGTDYVTNYVEWVNDSDGSALSITNAEFTPFGESNEIYFQSGVKYFTVPTGSFKAQASHAYSNVFSGDADGISITHVSNLNAGSSPLTQVTGSGITNGHATSNQMALPDLDTGVSSPEQLPIFITSSIKFTQTTSLPGGAVSGFAGTNYGGAAQVDVKHPLNGTQTSGNIHVGGNSSKKFLVFSGTMGDGNLYTSERFGREDFRLISGSYDAQGDIGFASRWDSSKDMNDSANVGYYDGLIVYNGNLASPTDARLPGSGDFRSVFDTGTSDIISPLGNVNYETLPAASSSHRSYFRYFENNTTNNVLRIGVTLFGDATIVGKSGALSGSLGSNNNIYLEGKIPGKTGWMDLGRDTLGSGNTSDGDGGRVTGDVTVDSSGALTTFTFNGQTLDGTGTGPDKVVLKITAHKDWSGNISRLDVNHSV